jgi:hypothetical protein
MRLFTALALGVFVCCAQAQEFKYRVVVQGQDLGEAKLTYNILPNKGLRSRLDMRIAGPGGQMSMQVDETCGPDGSPIKGAMQQSSPAGAEKVVRTFSAKGVTVISTKNGKTTTKLVPYPKNGSIKSPSTLWFITTRPKLGATDKSFSLHNASMKWELSTTTYKGVQAIMVKGKSVKAHAINSKDANLLVDEKGMPYRIEFNESGLTITLERK